MPHAVQVQSILAEGLQVSGRCQSTDLRGMCQVEKPQKRYPFAVPSPMPKRAGRASYTHVRPLATPLIWALRLALRAVF